MVHSRAPVWQLLDSLICLVGSFMFKLLTHLFITMILDAWASLTPNRTEASLWPKSIVAGGRQFYFWSNIFLGMKGWLKQQLSLIGGVTGRWRSGEERPGMSGWPIQIRLWRLQEDERGWQYCGGEFRRYFSRGLNVNNYFEYWVGRKRESIQ